MNYIVLVYRTSWLWIAFNKNAYMSTIRLCPLGTNGMRKELNEKIKNIIYGERKNVWVKDEQK